MARVVGLRIEILVNLALVVGAALLFSGFLLLKLTENELIGQRVTGAVAAVELLVKAVSTEGDGFDGLARQVPTLLPTLSPQLEAWTLHDREFNPVKAARPELLPLPDDPHRFRFLDEPRVVIDYGSGWLPFRETAPGFLTVSLPLRQGREFIGVLQVRLSLDDIRQRLGEARQLVLLFALLYGVILLAFGLYLLGRNVVRPIGRLRELTQQVGAGRLDTTLEETGPREIVELTASFNRMTAALRQSRAETERHIASLQQVNEQLIRSEKMASVGHLAAGMAHEIGNPLGAVVGYLELLKAELGDESQRDLAARALVEAARIDRLVRELLDFAVPAAADPAPFDPVPAVREVLELLDHQGLFARRALHVDLPPQLPRVILDRHRLQQVLVNLLLNACDATGDGQVIRVTGGSDGAEVWLAVGDDGSGMTAQVQAQLFEPFFSTKAPGEGRGLGLAICQRIVQEAGGRIEVNSAPGQGSEFRLWFPTMTSMHDGT